MPSLLQKVIRLGFGLGAVIAPDYSGIAAFRLFSRTPARKPRSKKGCELLESARPVMARAERIMLPISSGLVAAHSFAPLTREPSETILIVHGWGSRSEHMLPLIEALRSSGKAVIALDLPGHGLSTGRHLNMAIAVEAVDAAWRQFGPFSTMIGYSFGGAVVINAAFGSIQDVPKRTPDRVVTISAPNSLPDLFDQFSDWIGLREGSRAAMFAEVKHIAGRPLGDFVGERQLAALKRPTLVVHAHDDKEVSVDNAYGLVGAGPQVEVFWADGYGHRRILGAPEVAQVVVDFVENRASHSAGIADIQGVNQHRIKQS